MLMVLLVIAAFVAGSVPFGVLIARARGVSIQEHGSGNIGATNVTRVLGARAGAIVLVLDAAKGALPTYLALRLCGWPWVVVAAGAAAILGHCFSPFLRGRGGKGVATALGVLAGFSGWLALACIGIWVAVAAISRYSSLAALAAAALAPLAAWQLVDQQTAQAVLVMSLLLVWRHKENIRKLMAGTESRIGSKKN